MGEKLAVVTGGNKGIGFEIVRGLCEKFNGIVYLTARDIQRGEDAVNQLEKQGFYPKFHQLDINDQTSVNHFRDYIKENHGGLDVLVNNAGILKLTITESEPVAVKAEETIKTNYFGLIRVSNALFPLLRPHARVVNLTSSCGHLSQIPGEEIRKQLADPNLTEDQLSALMLKFVESVKNGRHGEDGWGKAIHCDYIASKNGISALTIIQQKKFDADSNRPGICVNAVHPGYVITNMTGNRGELSAEQGADAPLYLALLPPQENKYKGCYIWKDRQIVDWRAPTAPGPY